MSWLMSVVVTGPTASVRLSGPKYQEPILTSAGIAFTQVGTDFQIDTHDVPLLALVTLARHRIRVSVVDRRGPAKHTIAMSSQPGFVRVDSAQLVDLVQRFGGGVAA